jgi:hypothetical protein
VAVDTGAMRPARILLAAVLAVLSLAVTAVATAVRAPVENGTLSVRDGRASLQLRMRGGVIGRLGRGNLTVTEPLASDTLVVVHGEERTRYVNARTTVYSGKNIRFRIAGERRFAVRVNASKINLSAVGRGDGWLDGRGDPEGGVFFDGSYSLNGEEYQSVPDLRERFELAAPPSSP